MNLRRRVQESRKSLACQADILPPIPRVAGGPLPSRSALSPLVCCLDPGHRFPIVNNAQPVKDLLAVRGIRTRNTVGRVRMMLGLIGRHGVVDAFYLDTAAMYK